MSTNDYIDTETAIRAAHRPRRKLHPYMANIISTLDRSLVHKSDLIDQLQQERHLDPETAIEIVELIESLGIIYRDHYGYRLRKRPAFRAHEMP